MVVSLLLKICGALSPSTTRAGKLRRSVETPRLRVNLESAVRAIVESNLEATQKVGMGHQHDSKRTQRKRKTTSVADFDEVSRVTALDSR